MNFGIKIKGEKAEIMASKVVFVPWIAKANDEFHRDIITDR